MFEQNYRLCADDSPCENSAVRDILAATLAPGNFASVHAHCAALALNFALDNGSPRRWFVRALRQYPWSSAALVALSVLTSFADGLSISLLIPFLTLLFDEGALTGAGDGLLGRTLATLSQFAGEGRELAAISCLIVLLVAFRCALAHFEGMIASRIKGNISKTIRLQAHENLLRTDYDFLCLNDNGKLLNTLDSQTWSATEAITAYFGLITSLCMTTVFTSMLLFISWQLTLLVAALVGIVSLAMLPFDKRMRVLGADSLKASEDLSERAVELFDAMRMIRVFGREALSQQRYEQASQRMLDLSLRDERLGSIASSVQEVLYAVNFVVVVLFALRIGLGGAALIGFLVLLHRLQPHVRHIDGARMHLAGLSASVLAVSKLLELPRWTPQHEQLRPNGLRGAVRFDHVTFSYEGKDSEERSALDDVTLELPIGKVTGIVGWSGAGKSTLINLLFRLHDPATGSISVDGIPLPRLDLGWWRSQLAIAGQDAELLGGTVRENIEFGTEGATMNDVVRAAKQASAHAFITALPLGYETRIGGRGALLSAGQRQRIGLARALVRESPILVLDEATNAVDAMTEAEIQRALESLRGKTTVIVIAHRLSTVHAADHIVAMAAGRVVETGKPAELLRRQGLYAQMVELQEFERPREVDLHVVQTTAGS